MAFPIAIALCCALAAGEADVADEVKAVAEAAAQAGLHGDAETLEALLHPQAITCDPIYGVLDSAGVLEVTRQGAGHGSEAELGEWNPEVHGSWALFEIPFEGPGIGDAGFAVSSGGLMFHDGELWRVAAFGTIVRPLEEGALPDPYVTAFHAGEAALPGFLEQLDQAVCAADGEALRALSRAETRIIGWNPETGGQDILGIDRAIEIAEEHHPANVTFERLASEEDTESVGAQVAFIVRTYSAVGTTQPLNVREAFLLWWEAEESRWSILASAYAIARAE